MPWAFFIAGPYINIEALQKVKAGRGAKCLKARKKRASNVQGCEGME